MPAPSVRYKLLPARGDISVLTAAVADIAEGEICYALDENKLYVKEGGVLVAMGGSVASVNTQTGVVVLDADDISDAATTNKYTTQAEIDKLAGIETGATADQTGAEIKAAYEGELDTNAFTDAEKTKLSGIASGAEVNVNADWNAVSGDAEILNKPALFSGSYNDLTDKPTIPPAAPVDSVNSQTGAVVLDADDIDDTSTAHKFATAAQLSAADSATQPGDNVSTLTNDAGYITDYTVTSGDVTAHQGDLAITHTQVTDFDAGVQANRLDQMAQPTAAVAMNSQRITGLADPTAAQDAVTKAYADALVNGLDVKKSVRVATTADITLSNTQTIDGVALVAGDRVLVKDQSTGSQNGIYDVVSGGAWTRSSDADNSPESEVNSGMFTFVEEGTANGDAGFVLTTANPIVLDTTALAFTQFSGAGQLTAGAGLTKSGTTLDIGTASSARIVVNADDIDLATVGTAGTYNGLTIDAYGRATAFTSPTTLAGYSISDAQPLDATLTALAGVTVAADEVIYSTGADTFATTSFTAFGRSLVDDADNTAARTTLGLGSISTQDASSVAITGGTIDNIVIDGGTY